MIHRFKGLSQNSHSHALCNLSPGLRTWSIKWQDSHSYTFITLCLMTPLLLKQTVLGTILALKCNLLNHSVIQWVRPTLPTQAVYFQSAGFPSSFTLIHCPVNASMEHTNIWKTSLSFSFSLMVLILWFSLSLCFRKEEMKE